MMLSITEAEERDLKRKAQKDIASDSDYSDDEDENYEDD
jgi:hypothetical protein